MAPWRQGNHAGADSAIAAVEPQHMHQLLPPSEFVLNSAGSVSQRLVSATQPCSASEHANPRAALPEQTGARESIAAQSCVDPREQLPGSLEAAANQMSRPQPGSNQASHAQPGMHSRMVATPQWPATTPQPTGTGRQIFEEQLPLPPELVDGAPSSPAAMRQLAGRMASEDVVQRAAEGADAAAPLQPQLSKLSELKRHLSHGRSASHMRMASDDFEHSAGPITSNGLGDASCSLPGAKGRLEHHMR